MKALHGGKRKGSGQKPKYGEETKTISFRVPESKVEFFKELVKKHLKKFRQSPKKTFPAKDY